ncbi:MAG TPA: heavy metal translocating P-type ATPase [Desulfitobacteriaceae bacterium]|nr:heavy metal translocating P-type ATPase [Desulfitobacteriaceae bacterium]
MDAKAGLKSNYYVHALPGRIRLRVPGLKNNSLMANCIRELAELPGYQLLQINIITGSVIIFYNQAKIDQNKIIIEIDERRKCSQSSGAVPQPASPWTMKDQKNYLALVVTTLGFLVLKQGIFGPSSLTRHKALTNVGIFLSLMTGYPILNRLLKRFQQHTRFNIFLLIRYTSFLLLVLQESTGGLLITSLVQLSCFIAQRNLDHSRRVIEKMSILPQKAWALVNGDEIIIPADRVTRGDRVVVHGGETITVDGPVISGQAEVDESRVTGFTEPVWMAEGNDVLAGSEVITGTLTIAVKRTGSQTFLSQIIQYVNMAGEVEAPDHISGQEAIERLSALTLILACLIFIFTGNSSRSLTMLLAALPSAANLAVPASLGMAVGGAAKKGIYVKEAENLLAAGEINLVAFDKTGALANGQASIEDIVVTNKKFKPEDILSLAMLTERSASHPVIEAIRQKVTEMRVGPLAVPEQVEIKAGYGVEAMIDNRLVIVGNQQLMESKRISLVKAAAKVLRYRHLGLTPVFVAVDRRLAGFFAVREHLKKGSQETILQLRTLGIDKFILLTGDTQESAETVGTLLGIKESYGWLDPEQKADKIRTLKEKGFHVVVVGDGVDDGLAMAEADVGFSLGRRGGDSSARVAGIILASRDPRAVVKALHFARKTREITKQNLNFTIGLNVIGLGLATAGLINPVTAAGLGSIGTLAVLVNSMSLRK